MTKGRLGIRELAHAYEEEYGIKMPKSTMHRYCFLIGLYNVDSYLKPHLTIKQVVNRVKFVLDLLGSHNQSVSTYGDQNLAIDIDEKWFYVVPMKRKIRMYPEDEYPGDDTSQHKSHIPKIMILAAIGKLHMLPDGTQFNSKIGIWPFTENVEAARGSKNCSRGTLEIRDVSASATLFYNMVIKRGGLLDCIQRKLRAAKHLQITVWLDSATPHTGHGNFEKLRARGQEGGWKIVFEQQPASSLDLNKLDLSFFYSLQQAATKLKGASKSLKDLVSAVTRAYREYDVDQLARVHALTYIVYRKILENLGSNQYDMPHTGIRVRQTSGQSLDDRTVSNDVVRAAREFVRRNVNA